MSGPAGAAKSKRAHAGRSSCPECGARTLEYSKTLRVDHVDALAKLYEAGGPTNLRDLRLSHTQLCTSQELRHWGLIESATIDGKSGGVWAITVLGCLFVEAEVTLPATAWTYRGDVVSFAGADVSIHDVTGTYADHPYQARRHAA